MYRADFCPLWKLRYHLILYAAISQNGQTLKQFVGKIADELFECVWPFCGIGV